MITITQKGRASMKEVTIVSVDLAKRVFQLHGAAADGSVVFRKKVSRTQLLAFLAKLPACTVAMEACATSHHWGREIGKLGHAVRLIPPIYVKPFVKRQKNDAADAEAIAEAASRPTMRFVALKTEEQQSRAMIFRTRDLLVRQRTQLINALRGHLAEYGIVTAQGIVHAKRLQVAIEDPETGLPPIVRDIGRTYLDQVADCSEKIAELEKTLRTEAAQSETTARLQTMPGIGPISAMAIESFAPPMDSFRRGRDFAAWLGLVPRQSSTGGKQILGKTSKMGQRDIRRLLIIGAMAVVGWAARNGASEGSWLARMLARKPRMVVAIALANKMARSVWAMLVKRENYRDPAAAAA
jgi:transposase